MAHRPLALVFSLVILIATAYLFWSTPKGLFPTDDTGQLLATTEAAEGVSFDALVRASARGRRRRREGSRRALGDVVGRHDGGGEPGPAHDRPQADRRAQAQRRRDRARSVARPCARVPDITVFVQNPPAISIGGLASKSLYQYTLQSGDINVAQHVGARARGAAARSCPASTDVTSDLLIENPQVTVDIDREQAGQLGVSASEIENTLYDAFGQRQVSTIYTSTNEYWVVMELLPQYPGRRRRARQALGAVVARAARAAQHRREVPLHASGPVTVNHSGQLPSVTISFNLAPGVSLGTALTRGAEGRGGRAAGDDRGELLRASREAFVSTQQGLLVCSCCSRSS